MSPKFDVAAFVQEDLPHFTKILAGGAVMKEAAGSDPTPADINFDRTAPMAEYECVSKIPEVAVVTVAPTQDYSPV